MAAWSAKEIVQRALEADSERARYMPWVDECLAYTMPWRRKAAGSSRLDFDRLFDSTATIAVPRFGGKLHAGMTPQFGHWFGLEAGPLAPKPLVDQLNQELEPISIMCQAVLDVSAYHLHAREMFSDLSVGEGAICIQEGDDDSLILVDAAPSWALGFEEGPLGKIDNVYLTHPFKARQLPGRWPKAKWPKEIAEAIADTPNREIHTLQASYYDSDLKGWRLAVVVRNGDDREIVWETSSRTNPWIIPRYWTAPRDPRGRGPTMLALPDIKTGNKTVEMVLQAAAYQLAPPIMVLHDGVVNPDQLRMSPRALIRVGRTGGPQGRSLEPMDIGSKVDLAQIILQEQRSNIKSHLHDEQLPPMAGAVRSASEIIERAKSLQADDSNAFTGISHDVGPPLITRVMDILDRKKVGGIDFQKMRPDFYTIRVSLKGPLARAQALEDAQGAIQWAEAGRAVGGPELFMHSARVEDLIPYLGRKMGVSPSLIRTAQERQQIEHATGAALAAQAAAQQPDAGAATAQPFALPSAAPVQMAPP